MNNYPQGTAGASPFLPDISSRREVGAPALIAEPAPRSHMPEINLGEVLRILLAWRWLILGFVAVFLVASVIITLLTTPLYRATTRLEINPPQVEIIEGAEVEPQGRDRMFLTTQYGLLKSRSLAERVAQDLNLGNNELFTRQDGSARSARTRRAAGALRNSFEVTPVVGSRLIDISFSSSSPAMAARVVNSFADNFIASNLERRYESSSYARNFLERRIATVKAELESAERAMVAYAQREGLVSTTGESGGQSLEAATLNQLNTALAQAQSERIAAEQAYRQAVGRANSSELVSNGTVQGLRSQRAQVETEYQEKLQLFKPDYPDMVRLRARMTALDEQIRSESGHVAGGMASSLQQRYLAAAAQERSLQARVSQLRSQVLDVRGRSIQYNILQRELDTNRSLYDALLQRYKEIGVAGGIGTNMVSVVDRAQTPGSPYTPNLLLNLLIALGAGLATGIGIAFAIEFINDTIKTPEEVRNKLQLASLGAIPVKPRDSTMSEQLEETNSPISEAYYSLRTSLQFSTPEGAPRLLLVTSTRAAEGKSSTTMALAQNFARLGKSVLLIDGDMRKPAFVTGSATSEGLSNLLTGTGTMREHILETKVDNLWLLPCGALPPNPAELLAAPQLKILLAEAKQHFDMVIVDGPPVLGLADAPLLGAVCDGTLLVIEGGKTRRGAVLDAILRLRGAGSMLIGAVLTKYKPQTSSYGYKYEPYRYGGGGVTERERQIKLIAGEEQQLSA